MDDNQKISGINYPSSIDVAISAITDMMDSHPATAEMYYERGRLYWRRGLMSDAISDYEHALALDPESPAKQALEMARSVMDFFNPDLLNP